MSTKTAEAVCIGHPDKLCDLIADQILDDILWEDKAARVAVEVMAAGGRIIVTGEITTKVRPRIRESVRSALAKAGVTTSLEARGGDTTAFALQGAGDQGTVYGYATAEIPERLPLPLVLAHLICERLDTARVEGTIAGIKPDGKAQVSVRYDDTGTPAALDTVIVSVQHDAGKYLAVLECEVRSLIVAPACQLYLPVDKGTEVLVNPSARFVEGGPRADTGLTGRKLMVDSYGGLAPHGGGAFSGKDPSKVDRSAAYMARLIARTVVDAGLAAECQVAISYAIGKADPVAFEVDTLGTGEYADHILTAAARDVFVLRPAGIIDTLNLHTARYRDLAVYGHVGRDWPRWEQTWRYERDLRKAVETHAHRTATHR